MLSKNRGIELVDCGLRINRQDAKIAKKNPAEGRVR
jgi:hypothetical protein